MGCGCSERQVQWNSPRIVVMTDTVKMQRDGKDADVHPEEVRNYGLHGWRVVDVVEDKGKAEESEPLVSIYKLTDGARGARASKANVTAEEAAAWIADHPGDEYEVE